MPSKKRTNGSTKHRLTIQEQERDHARKALRVAVKRERDIQRLGKQYERELQKTNDAVQHLAILLSSRARALEAEQESAAALRG